MLCRFVAVTFFIIHWQEALILLQQKVFKSPLQQKEMEAVFDTVRNDLPSGVRNGGLTEAGFVQMHASFIRGNRLDTAWKILKQFGYGMDLRLTEEFQYPRCVLAM